MRTENQLLYICFPRMLISKNSSNSYKHNQLCKGNLIYSQFQQKGKHAFEGKPNRCYNRIVVFIVILIDDEFGNKSWQHRDFMKLQSVAFAKIMVDYRNSANLTADPNMHQVTYIKKSYLTQRYYLALPQKFENELIKGQLKQLNISNGISKSRL